MKRIPVGARVRVRQDRHFPPGPWPGEPTGVVVSGPVMVRGARWWQRHATYDVEFDVPQRDTDGDGPYSMSEVLGQYLEVLPRQR